MTGSFHSVIDGGGQIEHVPPNRTGSCDSGTKSNNLNLSSSYNCGLIKSNLEMTRSGNNGFKARQGASIQYGAPQTKYALTAWG